MRPRVTFERTDLFCGHCETALHFMHVRWPFPKAWYVHRDDHRFRCHGHRWWGANTNSAPLVWTLRR